MKNISSNVIIGIDLGDRKHALCVLKASGEIEAEFTLGNDRDRLRWLSEKYPRALMVMEVGAQSPWISRYFEELGHRVLVANPRKVRAIYENDRKCDRKDAAMLAKLARADESLLSPIRHGSEDAQRALMEIKQRDNLVRQRVNIITSIRFTLKSLGIRTRSPKSSSFAKFVREDLAGKHGDELALIEPSLKVLETLNEQIKALEKSITTMAEEQYPETEFLRQITGVGVLTSLAFVLTIEDPQRFSRTRDIGAFLGLVPKRDQSGNCDKQLRISKAGDAYLRRLLISAAQYILGPFGPDCDLKEQGLKLAERGGARAKKKAVVAVARKLAVLMLTLWKNEDLYQNRHQPA
jgi:transposase